MELSASEIQNDFNSICNNTEIFFESNFKVRFEALDFLEFNVIDRLDCEIDRGNTSATLISLLGAANSLKHQLEIIDEKIFHKLRHQIQNAASSHGEFLKIMDSFFPLCRTQIPPPEKIGYDHLDVFVNGILNGVPFPTASIPLSAGMVYFQKTPVRIVLEMISQANFTCEDVFCDLGSGFGQVIIMVNLLTKVRSLGIEVEPAYTEYSKNSAASLNLNEVEFIQRDAREFDYSKATVFFLYSSFDGKMLEQVLHKMSLESRVRVKLFTYGPCTKIVAQQKWLQQMNPVAFSDHQLARFERLV